MSWDPTIDDEELEGLLHGSPEAAEANLDLTRFVGDLRTAFPADAPAADAHLAAIMETASLFADNGDPAAMPASNADAPASQVSWLPKRKGNHMKERKWRVLVLRVAAPIVALFTVLGIMGSAGALPRTLQRLTSNAAGVVGVSLPTGDDEGTDTGTTEDDQGENVDDQGDNSQGDSTDTTNQDDQGDNSQGDSTSTDTTNQDDQGDNSQGDSTDTSTGSDQGNQDDQGSTTNQDDQGDNNQGDSTSTDSSNQDDQGDNSGDSSSSDSGSGGGDNNQN